MVKANIVKVLEIDNVKYKVIMKQFLSHTVLALGLIVFCRPIHAMQQAPQEDQSSKNDSVSYIYYPTCTAFPIGHADFEVNGMARSSYLGHTSSCNMTDMIQKSKNDGLPFFRFSFKAEPNQVGIIKKSLAEERFHASCSTGALYPLHNAQVCFVPMPFTMSPLASAAYLTAGKKLGLNNVQSITYYGNPSLRKSVRKMLPGFTVEMCYGLMLLNSLLRFV